MSSPPPLIGETFLLGFEGQIVPSWIKSFAQRFGLGGVILFEYSAQTKSYGNNISTPTQVKQLCHDLHQLSAKPMIFIDQEGGVVCRLKSSCGFSPLPSQAQFAQLNTPQQEKILESTYAELSDLGIDFNLAPVVDLNLNPENPDIGRAGRSFGNDPELISRCVNTIAKTARSKNIFLCLKHFPGLGGASVNSHLELTDISDSITDQQLELFYRLSNDIPGKAILISHGIVKQWDPQWPCSVSEKAIAKIRSHTENCLLISDDIQMQGLTRKLPIEDSYFQCLRAGIDLVCIGHKLENQEDQMFALAEKAEKEIRSNPEFAKRVRNATEKLRARKDLKQL